MDKNIYKFSEDDLAEVLTFLKDYHLNPTKGLRGRTNQGKRGFGGELDEMLPGKLLEIAVHLYKQAGNAVTVPMIKKLAQAVLKAIE